MARDIHNVTDDVSLVMREVIDATENEIVLQTSLHLNKGAKSDNAKDYIKTQVASKRQLNNKLQQVANKSQKMLNNVIDNIGSYTGTDTKALKKDTAMGMKMLVKSAKSMQNKTLKKVSRLERYKKSANFIADLNKSIVEQSKLGIDKGLPVTYKNGRKVTYKAYMEMAVRTGIQQEIGNRQLETGGKLNIVFYVVNEFGDCADDHANYQGRMYYDERYQDFPLRDEIKGLIQDHIQRNGLLSIQAVRDGEPYLTTRPNCRHKMKPVAIDRVLKENVEDIKKDLGYKSKSYRPENYEAVKIQRYNERNIRKYKQRNLTYMEIYKKTNNKDYLLLAQKEKRKVLLWQKRHREHLKLNPDLKRGVLRENPRVLLQDLGLTNKKIQVDPNKPPTPITNKPPQNPPVPMSATVKEHLEVPEQNLTEMFTSDQENVQTHELIKGERKVENHIRFNPIQDAKTSKKVSEDIKPFIAEQNFNGKPRMVGKEEFNEVLKETPHLMIRTYGHYDADKPADFRKDFEEGEFYVDNTGGAMLGRGMYFYTFKKEDNLNLHKLYNEPTIDPDNRNFDNETYEQRIKLRALANITKFHLNGILKSDDSGKMEAMSKKSVLRNASAGAYDWNIKLDVVAVDPKANIGRKKKVESEFNLDYLKKIPDEQRNSVTDDIQNWYIKEEEVKKYREVRKKNQNAINKREDELFKKAYGRNREKGESTYSLEPSPEREKYRKLIGYSYQDQENMDQKLKKLKEKENNLFRQKEVKNISSYDLNANISKAIKERPEIKENVESLLEVLNGMDTGVKATMLGYDGYYDDYYNYMVMLNRSSLIVLNDEGEWLEDRDKFDMRYGAKEYYKEEFEY